MATSNSPSPRLGADDKARAMGRGLIACASSPDSQERFLSLGANQCVGDPAGRVNQQRRGQHARPLNPQRLTRFLREHCKADVHCRGL